MSNSIPEIVRAPNYGRNLLSRGTHLNKHDARPTVNPIVVSGAVGRNESCPCGSGNKFKRCHLPLIQEKQREAARPLSERIKSRPAMEIKTA